MYLLNNITSVYFNRQILRWLWLITETWTVTGQSLLPMVTVFWWTSENTSLRTARGRSVCMIPFGSTTVSCCQNRYPNTRCIIGGSVLSKVVRPDSLVQVKNKRGSVLKKIPFINFHYLQSSIINTSSFFENI